MVLVSRSIVSRDHCAVQSFTAPFAAASVERAFNASLASTVPVARLLVQQGSRFGSRDDLVHPSLVASDSTSKPQPQQPLQPGGWWWDRASVGSDPLADGDSASGSTAAEGADADADRHTVDADTDKTSGQDTVSDIAQFAPSGLEKAKDGGLRARGSHFHADDARIHHLYHGRFDDPNGIPLLFPFRSRLHALLSFGNRRFESLLETAALSGTRALTVSVFTNDTRDWIATTRFALPLIVHCCTATNNSSTAANASITCTQARLMSWNGDADSLATASPASWSLSTPVPEVSAYPPGSAGHWLHVDQLRTELVGPAGVEAVTPAARLRETGTFVGPLLPTLPPHCTLTDGPGTACLETDTCEAAVLTCHTPVTVVPSYWRVAESGEGAARASRSWRKVYPWPFLRYPPFATAYGLSALDADVTGPAYALITTEQSLKSAVRWDGPSGSLLAATDARIFLLDAANELPLAPAVDAAAAADGNHHDGDNRSEVHADPGRRSSASDRALLGGLVELLRTNPPVSASDEDHLCSYLETVSDASGTVYIITAAAIDFHGAALHVAVATPQSDVTSIVNGSPFRSLFA